MTWLSRLIDAAIVLAAIAAGAAIGIMLMVALTRWMLGW